MGDNYHFHLKNACNERIALAPFAALLGHYGHKFLFWSKNCQIQTSLGKDIRFSTVGKPFKCVKCGRGFYNAKYLKMHEDAVHLKLKPFGCTFCKLSFSFKVNLNTHLKRYHSTCNENVEGEAMNTKKKCGAKKAKSKKGAERKFG